MQGNKHIAILFLFSLVFAGWMKAQNAFEGVILLSAQNQERKEKASVVWKISGGSHRLDYEAETPDGNYRYSLIRKAGESNVVLLTEGTEKNQYFNVPAAGFPKGGLILPGSPVLAGNGRKLIAGVECREYTIRSGENSAVVWVGEVSGFSASQIPDFMQGNGILGALQANGISGIPLEFNIFNSKQELAASQTVAGITAQSVGSGIFEIPAGYEAGN